MVLVPYKIPVCYVMFVCIAIRSPLEKKINGDQLLPLLLFIFVPSTRSVGRGFINCRAKTRARRMVYSQQPFDRFQWINISFCCERKKCA